MHDDELVTEEWRPVYGWVGLYSVSNLGRVRSEDRLFVDSIGRKGSIRGRVLAPAVQRGYLLVGLSRHSKRVTHSVHRMVCRAFHGPPPSASHHACHNDGDKRNNRATNLRWATARENVQDNVRLGTVARGARNGGAVLTEEQTIAIRERYAAGAESIRKLAREHGVHAATISSIVHGKTWKTTGGPVTPVRRPIQSKLTPSEVREMRRLYRDARVSQSEIGRRFGVSQGAARKVVIGETYKWVTNRGGE